MPITAALKNLRSAPQAVEALQQTNLIAQGSQSQCCGYAGEACAYNYCGFTCAGCL